MLFRNSLCGPKALSRIAQVMLSGALIVPSTNSANWTYADQPAVAKQVASLRKGPAKNHRVSHQPRPASAPTGGIDGYAVAFTGTIEPVR